MKSDLFASSIIVHLNKLAGAHHWEVFQTECLSAPSKEHDHDVLTLIISENYYNHDDECDNDNENNDDNDQTCSICPKERFHYNDDEDDNDNFENYQTCSIRVSICPKER